MLHFSSYYLTTFSGKATHIQRRNLNFLLPTDQAQTQIFLYGQNFRISQFQNFVKNFWHDRIKQAVGSAAWYDVNRLNRPIEEEEWLSTYCKIGDSSCLESLKSLFSGLTWWSTWNLQLQIWHYKTIYRIDSVFKHKI